MYNCDGVANAYTVVPSNVMPRKIFALPLKQPLNFGGRICIYTCISGEDEVGDVIPIIFTDNPANRKVRLWYQ